MGSLFDSFGRDPVDAGEKISDFAPAVLAKGRIPPPPVIGPQYVFGATFPFWPAGDSIPYFAHFAEIGYSPNRGNDGIIC